MYLALDLEHTLIFSIFDPQPRPGLRKFLDWAGKWFGQDHIVIYSAVPRPTWEVVALNLVRRGHAPDWFPHIQFFQAKFPLSPPNWQKDNLCPVKDLRRICPDIERVTIVDDYEEYIIPNQRHRWIKIKAWVGDVDEDDRELIRVANHILKA